MRVDFSITGSALSVFNGTGPLTYGRRGWRVGGRARAPIAIAAPSPPAPGGCRDDGCPVFGVGVDGGREHSGGVADGDAEEGEQDASLRPIMSSSIELSLPSRHRFGP
jgi:hypothetical protein